jgi:hypothetical protein
VLAAEGSRVWKTKLPYTARFTRQAGSSGSVLGLLPVLLPEFFGFGPFSELFLVASATIHAWKQTGGFLKSFRNRYVCGSSWAMAGP